MSSFFPPTLRLLVALLVVAMSSVVTDAIPVLGGRFETVTDVQDLLNLALDAADMKEATDLTVKQSIYENGGQSSTSTPAVTLQSLSLDAKDKMAQSPMYNIFRHAFLVLGNVDEGETEGNFDGHPIEQYGDTLVNDLFKLNIENVETDAALVTSVWMAAVHELFQVLQECKASDKTKGLAALDRAVALWVGEGQEEGNNDNGHLLYNLAENAGERFDQDDGEAEINTQLMDRFLAVQSSLTGGSCDTEQGYTDMRAIVKRMIGLMTVPLVQNLIHYSKTLQNAGTSSSLVELYALSTIPRVAACDPSTYEDELRLEVLRDLKPNEVDNAISALQSSYRCLGITCADVGTYLGGVVPECSDDSTVTAAGYTTDGAGARQKSQLELDIKQIDIFLRFEAFGAAEDWYTHGWNAEGYALKNLAQNQLVPTVTDNSYIATFQSYYSGDNFADSLILNILDLVPPYNSASKEQVRNMVTGTLTNVVMFMTSATSLQYAVQQCQSGAATALDYWDTGALFYIGPMEGKEENGNEFGGELLYTAAKLLCGEFGTCTTDAVDNGNIAVATVNTKMIQGLNDARDSIEGGSCEEAKRILNDQILPTMIVPLIQGTIKYASYNGGLASGTSDSSLAIGDTFVRGILPIVDQSNSASASLLALNMEFQLSTQPVPGTFASVADAMRTALSDMSTSCSDVGQFKDEPSEGNMCGAGAPVASPTSHSGKLGFGRYTFQSSDAAGDAKFALDVRDIYNSASVEDGSSIYYDGKNMEGIGLFEHPQVQSLSGLSLNMTEQMMDDPMFNIYKYALYDDPDLESMDPSNFTFGNDVVYSALTGGKDVKLASQAAVVMNVWMIIVHRLYEAQDACENDGDPIPYVDSAVALWIGEEQEEGKFDQGWMLYSVAQTAYKNLGNKEGEAKVNKELMNLFNELQATGGTCDTEKGQDDFYFQSSEIIRVLSKVLVLGFLSHLYIDGTNMVELYSVSIFPQAYACEEAFGDTLESLFALNYSSDKLTDDVKEELVAFLRCQRIVFEDLLYGASVNQELSNFLLDVDIRLNYYTESSELKPMAGYEPNSDVSEIARLDMDATLIRILMYSQAYESAKDVFLWGRSAYSDDESDYLSFQALLDGAGTSESPFHKIYADFYSSESYAEDLLLNVIDHSGMYSGASRGERADIAFRSLQTIISVAATFGKMQDSVTSCQNSDLEKAQSDWDSGVALFIGSTEGLLAGGRQNGAGAFMYSLSEEVCDDFGQCQSSGETEENQRLLVEFASGRDAVIDGKCDYLIRIIDDELTSKMAALLVQGFLSFSVKSQDRTDGSFEDFLVSEHVAAKAIMPLVDKVSSTSSSTLQTLYGDFSDLNSVKSMPDIVDAVANALRGMGVDCKDIGTPVNYPEYSLCLGDGGTGLGGNVPDQAPDADTPTDLGDGLYKTTTYVQDRANIAKDISDLDEALSSNNYNLAKLVYEDGKNSEIYDENGKFVSLRSLKSFSTQETNEMLDEPLFNVFMYGLQDQDGKFMSRDVRLYADSIVEDAFNNVNTDPMLPVEAMLAFNLWMHIAHLLYKTLKDCKNKEIKDKDGIHSIDIVVAYWIGDGQVAGSGDNGHLLYAMAERTGVLFNMDQGGQTRTNTNILKFFNNAKHQITLPGACSDSPSSYLQLSRLANNIISVMTIPLIQSLIHNLRSDDRPRVKLYAHAVVPLVAGCGPGDYEYLKGKLLNMSYNAGEIDDIIAAIRNIYPCLGLTCADIGVHETEMTDETRQCKDPDPFKSMAGYKPASDVGQYSRLDLDIRQLDILLEMKAYAAAENLYTYGKHVKGVDVGSMSLYHLASTSERKVVPTYDAFIRYYGNTYDDPSTYADHIIRAALDGSGRLEWTDAQRKLIVLKSAQVLVMYFGALQALYEAVSDCQSTSSVDSAGYSDQWDRGAALLIGSLEGTATNGSQEGYMYYDLAQQYCKEFNTCSEGGGSVTINEQLVSLLYTGRGAALSNSCTGLRKAADEISKLLLIPVIQGALHAATQLSKSNGPETDLLRAEGFVYSRGVLPLVATANWGSSQTIDEYLGFPAPSSTHHTASNVFSAFALVYPKMDVDCELIGNIEGSDPCEGVVYDEGNENLIWIIVGSVGGVCLLCCWVMLWRRRKRTAKLAENNPKFVAHETGELNHSMDLLEKAFSTNSGMVRTPNSQETVALAEDMHNDASPSADDDDFEEVTALKSHMDRSESDII